MSFVDGDRGIFTIHTSSHEKYTTKDPILFNDLEKLISSNVNSYDKTTESSNKFKSYLLDIIARIVSDTNLIDQVNYVICLYLLRSLESQSNLISLLEQKINFQNCANDEKNFYKIISSTNFGQILSIFSKYLTKTDWKNHRFLMDLVIALTHDVESDVLNANMNKIIIFVLLLIDDWENESRIRGLSFLLFILENGSPGLLESNNMHFVIFDALKNFWWVSESDELRRLYLNTIFVFQLSFEPKNDKYLDRHFHESFFSILLSSIEMANLLDMKIFLFSNLPRFIKAMDFHVAKFSQQLLSILKTNSLCFLNRSVNDNECKLYETLLMALISYIETLSCRVDANAADIFKVLAPISLTVRRSDRNTQCECLRRQYQTAVDALMLVVPDLTTEFLFVLTRYKSK